MLCWNVAFVPFILITANGKKSVRLQQLNSGICSCDDIISSYWIKTCLKKEKRHTTRHQYGPWIGINCKHDRVAEVTQFRSKLTTKPKKNFSTKVDAIFPWLHVSCAILRARPAMWAFLHEEAILLYTRKKDVYGKAGNIRAETFSQSIGRLAEKSIQHFQLLKWKVCCYTTM